MKVERNFDFFMAGKSEGLTQAGMGRLNQSYEAFVYCILGAQVTIRSSILGSSGSATEVQHDFLILVEDPIRTPEFSTSVQRFQLATDEAKVGLDLALSPSHLEIKLLEPDALKTHLSLISTVVQHSSFALLSVPAASPG